MNTFEYIQEIEAGEDLIERKLKIEYNYQAGEPPSRDHEYPGYPAGIDELYIFDENGTEVSDQIIEKEIQYIEDLCIKDMESNKPEPDFDWRDDESHMNTNCPKCGKEYDEIDYEYQICMPCKKKSVPEFIY